MSTHTLMRDNLSHAVIDAFSKRLLAISTIFPNTDFNTLAQKNLNTLGLSERIDQITAALLETLPSTYEAAVDILLKALENYSPAEDPCKYGGFIMIPQTLFIARFGQNNVPLSLNALKVMTPFFSSEEAIRYFIQGHEKETLNTLSHWINDKNYHVRRLVSEGTRPRLPWAMALPKYKKDPSPILPLLERLKDDPELYVRRSVANNLNDISKDNPELMLDICEKWTQNASEDRLWIIRHASRTLLKQGHPRALGLQGFTEPLGISVELTLKEETIAIGETLFYTAMLKNTDSSTQNLMIDYVIHYVKANAKQSDKVFKWRTVALASGEHIQLDGKQSFKELTTRKHYPGIHSIGLQINGKRYSSVSFSVLSSPST